jgi:hypothetical protein
MNRGGGAMGRCTRRFGLKNMILYIYIKSPICMSGCGNTNAIATHIASGGTSNTHFDCVSALVHTVSHATDHALCSFLECELCCIVQQHCSAMLPRSSRTVSGSTIWFGCGSVPSSPGAEEGEL